MVRRLTLNEQLKKRLVGAIVLVALPQLTDGVGLGWVGVTYGLAIVVIILLVPKGAAGLGQAVLRRIRNYTGSR